MRWRWTLICGLSLLPNWAGNLRADPPATASAPTTKPTTEPAAQAEPDDNLPVVETKTIKSAVKLSVENKLLRMSTDLPLAEDQTRFKIADCPGKTVGTVSHPPSAQKDDPFLAINLSHEISDKLDQTAIYGWATIAPEEVSLSLFAEDSIINRSVQYIQKPMREDNPDPENEKTVRLYITIMDKASGEKLVSLKLLADNVVELRRKYPRETAEYLQPLLAMIGQESVAFSVDHRTAWQVLSKHWPVDPKVDQQVAALVKDLDADEFNTRETASAQLEKLGEAAVLPLSRIPRKTLSSEQNSRLDAFLAPFRPVSDDEAKRLAGDVGFLLDCLYSDPTIRDTAIKQLREVTGKPIALDTNVAADVWLTEVRDLRKDLLPPPATKPATRPANVEAMPPATAP